MSKEQTETQDDIIPGTEELLHYLHHEYRDKIKGYFVELKKLLEDDQEFYRSFAPKFTLLSRGYFRNDIYRIIKEHYGNVYPKSKIQQDVTNLSTNIMDLVWRNKFTDNEISSLCEEDQEEVNSITFNEKKSIIGEVITSLDYCDV